MLKITTQRESGLLIFVLEGDLVGQWNQELEKCWRSASETQRMQSVRVDLSSVTFIDAGGKDLLKKMHREGAELIASGCMNRCIVEEISKSVRKVPRVNRIPAKG